jgi:ferritin-like protein
VDKTNEIISELKRSYAAELETLQNHLVNSIELDGSKSAGIQQWLEASVALRLTNARRLAKRISVIGGRVPGSLELPRNQNFLQPPVDQADADAVIRGVLRASEIAIAQYERIIAVTEATDYVTQDLVIDLLSEEREQRRRFSALLNKNGTPTCGPVG